MSLGPQYDNRYVRRRLEDVEGRLDAGLEPAGDATVSVTAQTFAEATYPTAMERFFAMKVVSVAGLEAEGQTVTVAALTPVIYAAGFGGTVPPPGTNLVVSRINGRWIFVYNG